MITIKCISNDIKDVSGDLKEFAFTQDRLGALDLTVSREYTVYGIRENALGKFYLILTDTIHVNVPWWMPASLFKVTNDTLPESWEEYTWHGDYGNEVIHSDPVYFDAQEDVEDVTERGLQVFSKMREGSES